VAASPSVVAGSPRRPSGQQYRCDRNAQQMQALLKEELSRKTG